jgi:hypothetical protein
MGYEISALGDVKAAIQRVVAGQAYGWFRTPYVGLPLQFLAFKWV